MTQRIVVLVVGRTFASLSAERGDYADWFREGLGVDVEVVRVADGEPLPAPGAPGGVVVTGSSAMVTERWPWSVATAAWLREAAERGRAILGVCYGHQLLADAFGGSVDWNPKGRQIGTIEATRTEAAISDPLVSVLPDRWIVQTSHRQSVLAVPEGAVRLASCERDPNHALRFRERVWGVQFHPEFDDAIARAYVRERSDAIREEGGDPDHLLAGVRASDHGRSLLRRFVEIARAASR